MIYDRNKILKTIHIMIWHNIYNKAGISSLDILIQI